MESQAMLVSAQGGLMLLNAAVDQLCSQQIVHLFLAIVPIVNLRVEVVLREVPRQRLHAHGA